MSSRRACSAVEPFQPLRSDPPARLRVAPPGAGARAGRVDQDEVGLAGRRRPAPRPRGRDRAGGFRRSPRRRGAARGGSRESRPRSVSQARIWPRPSMSAASASVLPPAPAHRSTTRMPGAAPQPRQMSWLPSSWTSTRPARQASPSSTREPSGRRRPSGDQRVGAASGKRRQRRVARALSRLTRRSSGARSSKAGSSSGAIDGIEPLEQPGRRDSGRRARLSLGDRRRPVRRAVEQSAQVRRVLGEAEHGGAARCRRLAGPADGAEDELAHRAPVVRAGIAPCLEIARDQGVGRRPAAMRGGDDLVEQLDRGLEAGGRRHPRPRAAGPLFERGALIGDHGVAVLLIGAKIDRGCAAAVGAASHRRCSARRSRCARSPAHWRCSGS